MQPTEQINKLVEEYGARFVVRQVALYCFDKAEACNENDERFTGRQWMGMSSTLNEAADATERFPIK